MKNALLIAVMMLSTLLIASIAVNAEGYGASSIANNTSKMNASSPMNASSGANASASAVSVASAAAPATIASANVSNATAKATNASAPYGTPGFEGILSLTGLMAMAFLAFRRNR
jgi:hypothetical protein